MLTQSSDCSKKDAQGFLTGHTPGICFLFWNAAEDSNAFQVANTEASGRAFALISADITPAG